MLGRDDDLAVKLDLCHQPNLGHMPALFILRTPSPLAYSSIETPEKVRGVQQVINSICMSSAGLTVT